MKLLLYLQEFLLLNLTQIPRSHLAKYYILIQQIKMQSNQEIRQNREKARRSLKKMLSIDRPTIQNIEQKTIRQNQPKPLTRMRRKTSADVKILGNCWDMFDFNEFVIQTAFEDYYELIEKIDEGAHSVVHKCREKQTQQIFAVKVIKIKDFDIIFNLKQQFRILRNLDHPNIIKAHNLFVNEKKGVSHLVCEYSGSENLRIHLTKNRVLMEIQVAEILSMVLKALTYIHSKGICHRDIKPDNILYNKKNGSIKVIDFEISKMAKYEHQRLQMWSNTGTVPYKAPQMLVGGTYFQNVDVWALGVMAYQLVTGTQPFRHLYSSQLIRKICEEEPNYDKPNVTNCCLQFIQKCLKKNPLQRFTAKEALQSPFILKYSSLSSSAQSPKFKKNGSQGKLKANFEIQCIRCLDEDSQMLNKKSLENDVGIRVVIPSNK